MRSAFPVRQSPASVPSSSRQDGHGKGYLASFSEGVFATILATPCTAPFLGSALGFAFAQPAGGILLIFATRGIRDGVAVSSPHRTSGLAEVYAAPGRMDGDRKAVHGLPDDGHVALAPVHPRQTARDGGRDLERSVPSLRSLLPHGLIGRFATLSASRRTGLSSSGRSLP